MRLLLIGIAVAAAVYLATRGHVLFLPLLLLLPLGFGRRGSRRRSRP